MLRACLGKLSTQPPRSFDAVWLGQCALRCGLRVRSWRCIERSASGSLGCMLGLVDGVAMKGMCSAERFGSDLGPCSWLALAS